MTQFTQQTAKNNFSFLNQKLSTSKRFMTMLIGSLIFLYSSGKFNAQYCLAPTTNITITPSTTTQTTPIYTSGSRAFNFTATAGCGYTFSTCGNSTIDTYLRLYSTGTGGTVLVSADDNCGPQSSFSWTCPTTGTYSVLLSRFSCNGLNAATAMTYVSTCTPPPPPPTASVVTPIGTLGNTNGTSGDPVCRYYNSIRYQVVYTSAELIAAGLTANAEISKFAWNVTEVSGTLGNYTIKMGHTTATNSATHNNTPTTQVKNPFSYTTALGYNDITLDVPFVWDGTSNLLIEICTGPSNPFSSPYGGVAVSTGIASGSRFYRTDGSSACGVATSSTNSHKPLCRLTWAPSSGCSGTPSTPSISGATSACAGVNFNLSSAGASSGTGISYQWQSSTNGGASWSPISGATATSLTTNASTNTQYQLVTTCSASGLTSTSAAYSVTISSFSACTCFTYPAIYSSSTFDEEISNVTVGSMNNSSNCSVAATGPGSILNRYANYAGVITGPSAMQTDVVNFSLTQTTCGGNYGSFFQLYVDWNQDGDWLDVGEQVYSQGASINGNQTVTGSFTVPAGATVGVTRMRVVHIENSASTTNYAHTAYFYGETEDYCFTVNQLVTCSGTPNAGVAGISISNGCSGASTTLSASGLSSGTGISYQWASGPTATGPWTNGATSASTTVNPTVNTYYQLTTTCGSSGLSSTSNVVSFSVNTCAASITMTDQFGDGWNGASMNVLVNGSVFQTITLAS